MEGWQRLVLFVVGLFILVIFFIALFITLFIANNIQYGVAVEESFRGYEVLHLTDEDFSEHQAPVDLIKNRKKILRTGILNYIIGHIVEPGAYSRMQFSPEEEAFFFTRNLEYNGRNFVVAVTM